MNVNWDEVVEEIGPRLYRYFCVRFDDSQADDLTQETLIRLVRKVQDGSFDPKRGTLRMLSFGIAHYVALEAKPVVLHESIDEINESEFLANGGETIEATLIAKDQALHLKRSLQSLSQIEQQVLSLCVDEELGYNEISAILKIPVGTIKSHIFRAKQKLFKMISKEHNL